MIDFDPQLNEMMTEARYIEQFDYVLPENIRHLALSVCHKKKLNFTFQTYLFAFYRKKKSNN